MANDDIIQVIIDAREDAVSLSQFMYYPAEDLVGRRLAPDINSLNYYLEYLDGLSRIYTQESGTVVVNGVEIKTVRQAMDDAIFEAGKDGWTPVFRTVERGLDYVIEIYDWLGGTGDTPETGYVYSGGITDDISLAQNIRGARGLKGDTSEQGIQGIQGIQGEKGDTGSAAVISSATASTGLAGTNASVILGGTSSNRTFAFTIPRGDKGEKGDTGELPNFYTTTTLDTPNVNIAADGTLKRSNDPLNASTRKVGTAAGNLVERGADGYPTNNNALGVGQTWQIMTASRASNVTYTNSTGRPIIVIVSGTPQRTSDIQFYVDGVIISSSANGTVELVGQTHTVIVPSNSTYRVTISFLRTWSELR